MQSAAWSISSATLLRMWKKCASFTAATADRLCVIWSGCVSSIRAFPQSFSRLTPGRRGFCSSRRKKHPADGKKGQPSPPGRLSFLEPGPSPGGVFGNTKIYPFPKKRPMPGGPAGIIRKKGDGFPQAKVYSSRCFAYCAQSSRVSARTFSAECDLSNSAQLLRMVSRRRLSSSSERMTAPQSVPCSSFTAML